MRKAELQALCRHFELDNAENAKELQGQEQYHALFPAHGHRYNGCGPPLPLPNPPPLPPPPPTPPPPPPLPGAEDNDDNWESFHGHHQPTYRNCNPLVNNSHLPPLAKRALMKDIIHSHCLFIIYPSMRYQGNIYSIHPPSY
ncbi:hypothetical protein B0H34DRAFT_672671 [Crassisporium funariophilum]|nr:hypothetical protein B0H34DRAFT_672671 [Crassisporium funariophilum]